MVGFIYLITLNLIIICVLSNIKKTKNKYWINYIALIIIHLLLLANTSDWNEGRMAGSSYAVPLLKPITDALYGFILLSIFSAFIPIIIYILLIWAMQAFCEKISG